MRVAERCTFRSSQTTLAWRLSACASSTAGPCARRRGRARVLSVVDWFAPVRARPRVVYRREWCMWFILYMVWCGVLEWYERGESGWTCLVRFFYKSKLRLNVGNRELAVAEFNISIRMLKFGSSRSVDRQSPKKHRDRQTVIEIRSKCPKSTKSRKITRTPKNDRHHQKSPPCAKKSQTPTRAPKFHRPTEIHQHPN